MENIAAAMEEIQAVLTKYGLELAITNNIRLVPKRPETASPILTP